MPKISVILPVNNAENTLKDAVKSILNQTFRDFELLIVNDGSTDSSMDIVDKFNDKRIRVIGQDHLGVATALNAGLDVSRGQYIARMDADDESASDRFAKQSAELDENPDLDIVSCLIRYRGDEKENQGYFLHVKWLNSLTNSKEIYHRRFSESPFAHPSVMFRKSLVERYGRYREGDFPEDYEMWLRCLHHGARAQKVKEFLLTWRDHKDRHSRIHHKYRSEAFFKLKAYYFSLWFRNNDKVKNKKIWICGYGKAIRGKSRWLGLFKCHIEGYIDIKKRSSPTHRVIQYEEILEMDEIFILIYVSDRKGKSKILEYLSENALMPGNDYYEMT